MVSKAYSDIKRSLAIWIYKEGYNKAILFSKFSNKIHNFEAETELSQIV